jgi:PAS domain S-box-containing protein
MEITLQNIEYELKNVIENASFPIGVYLGREMKIALANKAMIRTLGKGNDIIGRSYFEVLPELSGHGIFEKLLEVLETGNPYHVKNSRVDLVIEGVPTIHYFNYAFIPMHDAKGAVYGVMNTGTDVTDLSIARQQTQEAEEKLRLAVESAELGTYEINLFNDAVTISGHFRKIWDIDQEIITKELILSRLYPDDLHIREAAFKNIGQDGKVSYEIRIIHKDNSIHWLRINGTIIKNDQGIPASLVGIVQDITPQKQSEIKLSELVEQRTAELHRSNDDLLEFSRIVSHDLKEPIRKMKIFSQMLGSAQGEEQRSLYIRKIDRASGRMEALVDNILTYSSINASGFPVEATDLNSILLNIKKDLELLIEEKKAIFVEQQLPVVYGSPILLQRLLYNLVINALKFSKADQPPRVTISSVVIPNKDGKYIRITIEDNGIGLKDTDTEKIFNAFERLHGRDQYEGTGLGLAFCRKIVGRHNGIIRAIGKKDGTEFQVELPLKQDGNFV